MLIVQVLIMRVLIVAMLIVRVVRVLIVIPLILVVRMRILIVLLRLLLLIVRPFRLKRRRNVAHSIRVGLADQAREFRKRIALGRARSIVIVASASSARHDMDIDPPFDAVPIRWPERRSLGTCPAERVQPLHVPSPHNDGFPNYRISSGAWTPKIARPVAITDTTP